MGFAPRPLFCSGEGVSVASQIPDKTYQNKPVPFWQVGGDAYDQGSAV